MSAKLKFTQSGDCYYGCTAVAYQGTEQRPEQRAFPSQLQADASLSGRACTIDKAPTMVCGGLGMYPSNNERILYCPLQSIKQKQYKTGHPQQQYKEAGKQAQAGFLSWKIPHATLGSIQV